MTALECRALEVSPRRANDRGRAHHLARGGEMAKRTCSFDGCKKPSRSRGYCGTHYERFRRHGSADVVLKLKNVTLEQRFWSKVDKTAPNGCWQWCAAIAWNGYGAFAKRSTKPIVSMVAHRMAWELTNGPVPDGLVLDHLCRNRGCVNPDHLEVVTQAENIRRGLLGVLKPQRQVEP